MTGIIAWADYTKNDCAGGKDNAPTSCGSFRKVLVPPRFFAFFIELCCILIYNSKHDTAHQRPAGHCPFPGLFPLLFSGAAHAALPI
jgi:hypothetical protein